METIDVPLESLTAVVGPNGSGKTALLRAIDLVLGDAWPTLRSFRIPQDFTRFATDQDLSILIAFDPFFEHIDSLDRPHLIRALRVSCRPYRRRARQGDVGDLHVDFDPLGPDGDVPQVAVSRGPGRPQFRPLLVSSEIRDHARILFVDHRRNLLQHLPYMRGSVLGRLFEPARRELDRAAPGAESPRERFRVGYEAALEAVRTPRVREIERTIKETAKRMLGFLGRAAVEQVDVSFGFADPSNPLNSLRLVYREGNLVIPGEELGLGIQSAIVVGIFEALRQIGGEVGTVVIEEPEMYLHPQAQRYFYRLLTEMADRGEAQIICSTHSPIFADVSRFEGIRLIRKEPGTMSSVSFVSPGPDAEFLAAHRAGQRLNVGFDPARSELLFARRALLVEGPSDRLASLLVAEGAGYDFDAEDLAVVACGAKSSIPFFVRVCTALTIPFWVLHDEDILPVEGDDQQMARIRQENARAERENAEIAAAVRDPGRIFILRPSLEAVLGIGRGARERPRRVVEALQGLEDAAVPEPLREAVRAISEG